MPLDPKIRDEKDLIFGVSPVPLKCGRGITLGGGTVYPEINFTLPQMEVTDDTWPAVLKQYKMMTNGVCERAADLEAPGIVVEIELLPPMTEIPARGGEITALVRGILDEFYEKRGLASALRMTPVDIRDYQQPPRMRSGAETKLVLDSFEECARNGADLLSIESTGGKELHDKALLECDVPGIICALGVLAPRDMNFLWGEIEKIAQKHGVISAGDTACGFANTAMVLADKGMIPKVVAAVDRVAATVRSLQAFHQGAKGPSKDCAYEGPFLKVLTGMPISMEGRSAACAHLSGVGNIASAACDLWSNESVQNVRLLSGMAPTISMEQLIYDCRLMNQVSVDGRDAALTLRKWLVDSDAYPRSPGLCSEARHCRRAVAQDRRPGYAAGPDDRRRRRDDRGHQSRRRERRTHAFPDGITLAWPVGDGPGVHSRR